MFRRRGLETSCGGDAVMEVGCLESDAWWRAVVAVAAQGRTCVPRIVHIWIVGMWCGQGLELRRCGSCLVAAGMDSAAASLELEEERQSYTPLFMPNLPGGSRRKYPGVLELRETAWRE